MFVWIPKGRGIGEYLHKKIPSFVHPQRLFMGVEIFTERWEVDPEELVTIVELLKSVSPRTAKKLQTHDMYIECKQLALSREANIISSRARTTDFEVPLPKGLSLYDFQRAGIEYIMKRSGTLLADQMGLGKTVQALGTINVLKPKTVLIISPASLKLNWAREAERWLVNNYNIITLNGYNDVQTIKENMIVIVNYASLGKYQRYLYRHWNFLIVDECHYVKNYREEVCLETLELLKKGSQRAIHTFTIAKQADKKLFKSGTPMLNVPKDLWAFLRVLNPVYWGCVEDFNGLFDDPRTTYKYWETYGTSKLEALQRKLRGTVMVRRKKEDVLTELPPKIRQIIELPIPNECVEELIQEEKEAIEHYYRVLKEMDKDRAKDYDGSVNILNNSQRIMFSEISRVRRELAEQKIPQCIEFIKDTLGQGEEKVVVFCHHTKVVTALQKAFAGMAVRIIGKDSIEARQKAVDEFQENPTIQVFIGGIKSAGVGLTLTASSTVIFCELDWLPANISQAEDRCHRIGQKDCVNVYHLVFDGSLDVKMAKTIIEKQRVIDGLVNDDGYTTSP